MNLHAQMGGLKEAVDGLKEDIKELKAEQKEQTKKIEGIGNKVYAALAVIAFIVFLLQLLGPSLNRLIFRPEAPPPAQQQAPAK